MNHDVALVVQLDEFTFDVFGDLVGIPKAEGGVDFDIERDVMEVAMSSCSKIVPAENQVVRFNPLDDRITLIFREFSIQKSV